MLLCLACQINFARPAFDLAHSTMRQQPRSYELPSHPRAGLDWPAARLDVWLPLQYESSHETPTFRVFSL